MAVEGEECLFAHSCNRRGQRHGLVDHLRSVGEWAAEFAEPFGAAGPARWMGLIHDLGKASDSWQRRLIEVEGTDRRVGGDHKAAGCAFLMEALGFDAYAMAVQGHHGGLPGRAEFGQLLSSPDWRPEDEQRILGRMRLLMPELSRPAPPSWPPVAGDPLGGELLTRMLFSALVDADHLDTQVHFGKRRQHVADLVPVDALLDRFEEGRKRKLAGRAVSPIDPLRTEVYDACVGAAALPPGFFKLPAPTGLGKTMSSAGFALHHAVAHGMRRVIIAVPFVSITEQNAQDYRSLLSSTDKDPVLLEHHSSVDLDGPGSRQQRLAAENWDASFIVTTTVQLLQSLHDRRPSAMRKLHRLARSVIVLDEIQALPIHLLVPILTMLQQLVEHFGVTVLLASATQPEFWDLAPLRGVAPVEILPDPADLQLRLRPLRPIRYEWMTWPRPTLAQVAAKAAGHRQALMVVNTVAHAREMYEQVLASAPEESAHVRHLSTRMCPEHRRYVLDEVRKRLVKVPAESVLLVSTQLIEAGVDVDFPVAFREMAPADSILQAAGRVNREGLRREGLVVVFALQEQSMPPSYQLPVAETWRWFGPRKQDPDHMASLSSYYRCYYGSLDDQIMGSKVVADREAWNFPAVAEDFRMIEDSTFPVVVHYRRPDDDSPSPVAGWLERLRHDPPEAQVLLRRLQPYTASLNKKLLDKPQIARQLLPVIGDLHEWVGPYHDNFGIDIPLEERP